MHVSHILYSGLGGHGNVFFSFLEGLRMSTDNVSAVFYGIEEIRQEYRVKCNSLGVDYDFVKKRRGFDFYFFIKIFNALKKQRPAIVFLHGSYLVIPALVYCKFFDSKLIVRETQANHLKTKREWIMLTISLIFASNTILLSKAYYQELKNKLGFVCSKKRVTIIPNGLNLEKFKPVTLNNNGIVKIGMVSRLVKIKDIETLIKSVSVLNRKVKAKFELVIAGDGESRVELEELTESLKLDNVRFLGMLDEVELIKFMQSLSIYVHASYGETMSTSIMQAQAFGLPIVASNVKGINNVITNNENGLLVELKNEVALADSLELLVNKENLRKVFGKKSREYAEKYLSNTKMIDNYQKVFDS